VFSHGARPGFIIGAMVLAAGFSVFPAHQALASARSCAGISRPFDVCVSVNGSGRHINSIQGSLHNAGTGTQRHVHIELSGPHGVIKNCAATTIGPLQTIYCTWSPHANEPAGKYCATGWQFASGQYHNVGEPCVDVHN